jgi:predicted ATP-dependent Lon-type protease
MHQDVLDPKVTRTFAGKVVRKDLLHQIKGGENVPSYVLEYLLGRYCASDDEDEIRIGIEAVKETLRSDYFRHDEANKAQALVEQRGRHRFIDRVEVRFLAGESKYWAAMDHFGYAKIHVPDEFYRRYERLLEGGIWAIVDVEFRMSEDGSKGSPFHIADLRPIQLARFDLDEYIEGRQCFSREEWIDLIMKDYMANGRFSRGITQVHAEASLVFIGNLNQPVETLVQNTATDLFQPLPKEFDLALIDRLHFYLPGWEVPKNSKAMLTGQYGFVTDYLAEAFRVLRKQNRFDETEKVFRFGSHMEGRDATAAKKTVSGLLKILHPGGEWTNDELAEYVELALEGRRRVKEQLKKRGSFEFYKTSFSYIDQESGIERTVGLPEQGGPGVISQDPLLPGTIYPAAANEEAKVGLFRLEVTTTAGTGRLRTPGTKDRLGLVQVLAQKDLYAEAVDLSGSHIECPCGVAFFVALISAIQNRRIQAGTVILGDLTIQGNIKGVASIVEPLQLVMEGGALRALVPLSNKAQFAGLPEEVVEKLDIVFYGDVDRALLKSVELSPKVFSSTAQKAWHRWARA